jgi:hypothetical protein
MPVLCRIAECVLGRARRDASVVVVHEPTERFLVPGLQLGDRCDAVTFDDAQAAEVFLARHASEPVFMVVPAGDTLAA